MHELSLSREVAAIVGRASAGRPVAVVELRVGHLRQVVPDALQHAWRFTVKGTPLAGARLLIDEVPVRLTCLDCHQDSLPGRELGFACRHCQSPRTRITAGEEFMVVAIEVDDPDQKGVPDGTIPPP